MALRPEKIWVSGSKSVNQVKLLNSKVTLPFVCIGYESCEKISLASARFQWHSLVAWTCSGEFLNKLSRHILRAPAWATSLIWLKRREEDNELPVHQELSKAFKFIFYQRLCENVRNVVVSANYDKYQVSILDLISKMVPFYADVFCSWFGSCVCCSKHDACRIVFEDVRWL